jgi:hypothetical protein
MRILIAQLLAKVALWIRIQATQNKMGDISIIVDSVQYFPGLNCRTSYLHILQYCELGRVRSRVFTTFAKMGDFVYFAEFFIYANIFE